MPSLRRGQQNQPGVSAAGPAAHAVDRRSAILGVLGLGLLAAPGAAGAYDTIPEVSTDFAALESKLKERAAEDKIKTKELNAVVAKIESAKTNKEFVEGCDAIALWVIGNGKFPEGVKVKAVVERVKAAYDEQPLIRYPCKSSRQGFCERHTYEVEEAMTQVTNQMRKYSMIQLGDYRKVEFKAF